MTILGRASCRRLNQLPQTSAVWEGDRRAVSSSLSMFEMDASTSTQGDCILWVDGHEGVVRGIDVIPSDTGPEAIVRTLLQAMERPHGQSSPARPRKILVRDREIQFFLRGALQNLDIAIEYAAELPLIDDVFQGLQQQGAADDPELPTAYAEAMWQQAELIWQESPWEILDEQQIIEVEVNRWDIETSYLSILGMMGVEFGVLMYRSLESLQQFRQKALQAGQSPKQMQQAFLEQDCIFLTFDPVDEDHEAEAIVPSGRAMDFQNWLGSLMTPVERAPTFGSLHPLEGLRTQLIPEEALSTLVILRALQRFIRQHRVQLDRDDWPELSSRYRIPNPDVTGQPKTVAIAVRTRPDLMQELMELEDGKEAEADELALIQPPILQDDFVPDKALIRLFVMNWETVTEFQQGRPTFYYPQEVAMLHHGDGLPIILIHTSQPKGEQLIQQISAGGGVRAICFNIGEDPFNEEDYDLALMQTGDGRFHLLAEYNQTSGTYQRLRKSWHRQCRLTRNSCGLAIAKGGTGKHRGDPPLRDYMAIYEAKLCNPEDLGLPPLQLQFAMDWI